MLFNDQLEAIETDLLATASVLDGDQAETEEELEIDEESDEEMGEDAADEEVSDEEAEEEAGN